MKVLITGSDGFLAKNLIIELQNRGIYELMLCNRSTKESELEEYTSTCNAVIHLAGVNRPKEEGEFWKENVGFTEKLIRYFEKNRNYPHIIFVSSIQIERDNPYGRSKLEAEKVLTRFSGKFRSRLTIYRFPNVFGKWCRPNYNSVVATFCHNIARNMDIQIHDPNAVVNFIYIDDAVNTMIRSLEAEKEPVYPPIESVCQISVGALAELIFSFKQQRENLELPKMNNSFVKKLYSTYLSYVDKEDFKYPLRMNMDERGSFTEFIRTDGAGQVSVNVARPGIVKGNHWHHTKVEKFLVVKGTARILLRHMITNETAEYIVSGEKLEVVDIPVGYTHNISNIGDGDLVTIMWANESFDSNRPDTYYEEV